MSEHGGSFPSWARVGAKVVCIDGRDWLGSVASSVPHRVPMLHEVLTISVTERLCGSPCLGFIEVPLIQDGAAHYWDLRSFRPLSSVQKSQDEDIALICSLLDTERVGA